MVLKKDKTGYYGHKGHWLLLSRSTRKGRRRVLRIYGKTKPSKQKVLKDERRIQMFKHMKRR